MLARGTEDKEHAMSQKLNSAIAVIGIDIGKNSFHLVGQDRRGALVLRQKWSRGQVEARLANLPSCLIGMEACVGAHHLSRKLQALGHDARLMPAKYVRPYSKGEKNDYRDAEAIAEAVQRPTMNDCRAVLGPVKAWPGNTDASGKAIATASLDGPCARRVRTPAGRDEGTAARREQRNRSMR
jgi:transposase